MSECRQYTRTVLKRSAAAGMALRMAVMTASTVVEGAEPTVLGIILAALLKALKSGSAGFVAGTMQVVAFMWLRTVMNYQYKFGGSLLQVLGKLYKEGGVRRLYQGMFPWAIFQAPLSRFGDVAANDLVVGLFQSFLPQVPVGLSTFAASMSGAVFRIVITPIDTCKTILQTDGQNGMAMLRSKIANGGVFVLWAGWEGNYAANVVGNYPWFATMNTLQQIVPLVEGPLLKLMRSALLGAISSSVSDLISNSIRVVKTKKQTHADASVGYWQAATQVYSESGLYGLFFRGLETRIFVNVLQGAFFTVLWKSFSGMH